MHVKKKSVFTEAKKKTTMKKIPKPQVGEYAPYTIMYISLLHLLSAEPVRFGNISINHDKKDASCK